MSESMRIKAAADTGRGDRYRFDHFHVGIALRDFGFSRGSLKAGDRLPDATLLETDGRAVRLRDITAGKPAAIVIGSITCPLTVSALPDLNALERRFGGRVQFVLLQVREGHPGGNIPQSHSTEEKLEHARMLREANGVDWPVLVDDLDGSFHRHLDTMPNSLHLVAPDGEILYRALFAGDNRVEQAVAAVAAGKRPPRGQSQSRMQPILKSAGVMQDVLKNAGLRAYAEVVATAPPMIGLALGSKLFPFVSKPKRGLALVVTTVIGLVAAAATLSVLV